jgi:hypothetical protein
MRRPDGLPDRRPVGGTAPDVVAAPEPPATSATALAVKAAAAGESPAELAARCGEGPKTPGPSCVLRAAAEKHRAVIRAHLGYAERDREAAKWLDAILGFPTPTSRKVAGAKLVDAVLRKKKFTVGVMGISTTAGHDNYYNQSYSKVFERHFGTVLAAAGVALEVRNHAVGGFGVMPSHLCVHTMVGKDLDLLTWDFQMMAPRGDCIVENFARAALNMPTHPALMFWQGGVWLPKKGSFDPSNVKPVKSNTKQACGGKWMVDWYGDMGAHYGDLASVLQYLRYKGNYAPLAEGTDPMFMDPLKGKMPPPGFDEPPYDAWEAAHDVNGNGNGDRDQRRRRLARHHPGPALHRLWGLAWAHAYLGLLMEGLEGGGGDKATAAAAAVVALAKQKQPAAIKVKGCKPEYCKDVVPVCATTLLPRVEGAAPFLEDLVVGQRTWRLVDGDGRTGVNNKFGYVDGKMALNGDAKTGPLRLRFEATQHNLPLAVCQVPCPWGRCKGGRVVLEGHASFALDGDELPAAQFATASAPGPFRALVAKDLCFVVAKQVPKGEHTLTITPTAPPANSIIVSHLIYF